MARGILVPWNDLLGQTKARRQWEHRGSEPGELLPATERPCKMVITWAPGKKAIRVRCQCMAQARQHSGGRDWRYFNYDALGDAPTLDGALQLWQEHVAARA